MTTAALLFLTMAVQQPKLTATLEEAPGPKLVCRGGAEVPDGLVLNVEIYIKEQVHKLHYVPVQVKGGAFEAAFTLFKGRERNLPGHYRARVNYHPAFQPPGRVLEDVDPFHIDALLQIGTAEEIETAHKAVRDRLVADIREFAAVADEIVAASDAAQGKPDPDAWRRQVAVWKPRTLAIERRILADPDYAALGFGKITMAGAEGLVRTVRGLVEYGGAGRAADLRTARQQLDGQIRLFTVDIAPPGSTTAERRDLVTKARGAIVAALDAEDPDGFAATRRGFTESIFKLNVKAPEPAQLLLRELGAQGVEYFELASKDRDAARKLLPELDRKLTDVLGLLLNE